MATRCKVKCTAITQQENWSRGSVPFLYTAEFAAVSRDESPENAAFFEATPSVSIKVSTIKSDHFRVGQSYYLDFTEA